MSDGQFAFDPFWMFRWPLSGDVRQRFAAPSFSPSFTVNYAGDPKIEERVVTDVASYGRQLGWLTEIALALANGMPPPKETVDSLQEAANKIEAIKAAMRRSALEDADTALDRLEREQPDAYQQLLHKRRKRRSTRRVKQSLLYGCRSQNLLLSIDGVMRALKPITMLHCWASKFQT